MMLAVLSFLLLLAVVAGQPSPIDDVTILDPEEFKAGIDAGEYDMILDVRNEDEWEIGHIEGATLALNLASFPSTNIDTASPSDFAGCESCIIVIYCRSGARATVALQNLIAAGFNGTLYNGQGTSQWESAGYALVNDISVVPPCSSNEIGQCAASNTVPPESPSASPSMGATFISTTNPTPSVGQVVYLLQFDIRLALEGAESPGNVDIDTLLQIVATWMQDSYKAKSENDSNNNDASFDYLALDVVTSRQLEQTDVDNSEPTSFYKATFRGFTVWNLESKGTEPVNVDVVELIQKATLLEDKRLLELLRGADNSMGLGTTVLDVRAELTNAGDTDSPVPPATASPEGVPITLEPAAFKEGIDAGEYDVILDVRRQSEWDSGHIEGATFALNLALFGDPTSATATPTDFMGCETCSIVVYCRSGARAATALEILIDAGFTGTLYNGQGINQWQAAGYSLVNTDSVMPPCTKSDIGTCVAAAATEEPVATMIPTKIAGDDTAKSASNDMSSWSTAMLAILLLSTTTHLFL